jgi:hypothetical protein
MYSTGSVERAHSEHANNLSGTAGDSGGYATPAVGEEEGGDRDEEDEES